MSIFRAIYYAIIVKRAYDNDKNSGDSFKDVAKNTASGCRTAIVYFIRFTVIGIFAIIIIGALLPNLMTYMLQNLYIIPIIFIVIAAIIEKYIKYKNNN